MMRFLADVDEGRKRATLTFQRTANLLNCGMLSGLLQAFVFNPWDRALYLSVKFERPFLHRQNFQEPMNGVTQTIVQRAISAGLYFPLEEIFSEVLQSSLPEESGHAQAWLVLSAGMMAGMMNGIVMNPFSRIKYHYWGKVSCGNENFFTIAKEIFQSGGVRHFFVGTMATVKRDLLFGGCFAVLRHEVLPALMQRYHTIEHTGLEYRKKSDFFVNLVAGTVATIATSPLNYVRNIHYATPPSQEALSSTQILRDLLRRAYRENDTWIGRVHFVQQMMRIGWGTARVGCGMAFGAHAYDFFASLLV